MPLISLNKDIGHMLDNVINAIVTFFFGKLLKREVTEAQRKTIVQFIKFGIVGLSNTLISYAIYMICLLLFQNVGIFPRINYLIAQIIAFLLSVLWSFYWNNRMVFVLEEGGKRSLWRSLLKTYVSYSFTGLFLNSILLVLWVNILGISEFIAPIINLLVSVPLNFIINKFWTFKSK